MRRHFELQKHFCSFLAMKSRYSLSSSSIEPCLSEESLRVSFSPFFLSRSFTHAKTGQNLTEFNTNSVGRLFNTTSFLNFFSVFFRLFRHSDWKKKIF